MRFLVRAFLKGLPMQCGYFYNHKAAKRIDALIAKHNPDMLFGQLLRVAEYIRYKNLPKAIDYQDIFSYGMKRRADIASPITRPIYTMEYRRLKRYEAAIFDDFDVKTIISEPDKALFPHEKRDEILVIPNGVDHDYFKPQAREKQYDLVFTGNMSYPPNVNAVDYLATEIMPIVWKTLPETKLYIAGATPDPKVKKAASERIIVSGWLDDIRDAYAQSRVFIAPMRIGTGLQNKLLEAMSMRLPSITSPLANASLGAKPNEEILVGSNAEEMAQHIITLLTDKEKAIQIAQAGFDFTNRVYDWGKATYKAGDVSPCAISKTNTIIYGTSRRQKNHLLDGGREQNHPALKTNPERHLPLLLLWRENRHHRPEWSGKIDLAAHHRGQGEIV